MYLIPFLSNCWFSTDYHEEIAALKDELAKNLISTMRGYDCSNLRSELDNIRKYIYDAEDLIDSYVIAKELWDLPSLIKIVCNFKNSLRNLKKAIDSSNKMIAWKGITTSSLYHAERFATLAIDDHITVRDYTPCGKDMFIVGLEHHTRELVDNLTRSNDKSLTSLVITGMGGIGKTALAGKLYTHPKIENYFSCRIWITVGQKFDYKDLLLVILLTKANKSLGKEYTMNDLEKMVHEYLEKKRYLVVLDDVWTEETRKQLQKAFPDSSNGSRLIITTRNSEPKTKNYHRMKTLNKEDSWKLFCQTASIRVDDAEFKDISKKILATCDGLPLAIIVIGRELKTKKRIEKWEAIYQQLTSLLGNSVKDISRVLSLSYENLPCDLKSRFLRVAFFPEGREISARKLVYVLAAEGFSSDSQQDLQTMINRSLIEAVAWSPDGTTVKRCRIHPLMHVFAVSKAKEEIFFQAEASSHIRHQVINSDYKRFDKTPHLRSFLFFPLEGNILSLKLLQLCRHSRLLSVLYLEGAKIKKIPNGIRHLLNLKYLNLCNNEIKRLPSSMKYLLQLITLDVRKNPELLGISIVKSLKNLQNLHLDGSLEPLRLGNENHLYFLGSVKLQQIHNGIQVMKYLQVLKVIITDSSETEAFLGRVKGLEHLVHLKLVIEECPSTLPLFTGNIRKSLRKLHLKVKLPRSSIPEAKAFYVPMEKLDGVETTNLRNLEPIKPCPYDGVLPYIYLEFETMQNVHVAGCSPSA